MPCIHDQRPGVGLICTRTTSRLRMASGGVVCLCRYGLLFIQRPTILCTKRKYEIGMAKSIQTQTHITNKVNRAFASSEVMMVPFVQVLSHTEPICVIHRVIMGNRPFSCGHQTTSQQPSTRQKQRAKRRQRKKKTFPLSVNNFY